MRTLVSQLLMLVVLVLTTAVAQGQDMAGVYLTWQRDPTTTMTVNWVNLYPESSDAVFYRPLAAEGVEAAPWQQATAARTTITPSMLQRRTVELTGLSPDTTYELALEKAPAKPNDPVFRFRTMPAAHTRPIRFVTGGDMMHSRELLDPSNRLAAALDPDFAVLGGDLAYEDGQRALRIVDFLQSWMQIALAKDRRLIPMVPVIGNHEVKQGYGGKIPDDAPYFYGLFPLPESRAYHTLDFGNYLTFLVLDSGHTNAIDGPQVGFIESALEARKGQTYVFPIYHYPAYGTAKSEPGKSVVDHPRSVMIQKSWCPLFEKYGVSAVFENDHHTFKRTHPIRNRQRDDATGITYVGDGAWGVAVRPVPAEGTAWWLAKAESRNHIWLVTLTPGQPPKLEAMDSKAGAGTTRPVIPEPFDSYTPPTLRTPPMP